MRGSLVQRRFHIKRTPDHCSLRPEIPILSNLSRPTLSNLSCYGIAFSPVTECTTRAAITITTNTIRRARHSWKISLRNLGFIQARYITVWECRFVRRLSTQMCASPRTINNIDNNQMLTAQSRRHEDLSRCTSLSRTVLVDLNLDHGDDVDLAFKRRDDHLVSRLL